MVKILLDRLKSRLKFSLRRKKTLGSQLSTKKKWSARLRCQLITKRLHQFKNPSQKPQKKWRNQFNNLNNLRFKVVWVQWALVVQCHQWTTPWVAWWEHLWCLCNNQWAWAWVCNSQWWAWACNSQWWAWECNNRWWAWVCNNQWWACKLQLLQPPRLVGEVINLQLNNPDNLHLNPRCIVHQVMKCRRFTECLMKIVMVSIVTIVISISQLAEDFIIAGLMKLTIAWDARRSTEVDEDDICT